MAKKQQDEQERRRSPYGPQPPQPPQPPVQQRRYTLQQPAQPRPGGVVNSPSPVSPYAPPSAPPRSPVSPYAPQQQGSALPSSGPPAPPPSIDQRRYTLQQPAQSAPDWQPEPLPREAFIPFIDPSRSDRGPTLWRGPRGNAVNPGDILPRFQDKLSLVTQPSQATEEREGGYTTVGRWLREQGKVGEVAAGLPEAVLSPFTVPAESTEQLIGMGAQAIGVSPNVSQYVQRGSLFGPAGSLVAGTEAVVGEGLQAVMPFVRRLAAGTMRQLEQQVTGERARDFWGNQAQKLETWKDDPTAFEETVALSIVEARRLGRDTSQLERALEFIAPGRAEELISTAASFSSFRGDWGDPQAAARAATYSYEGLSRVVEARQRLEAGEDWETVSSQMDQALTGRERARDFIGQMLIEPTNAIAVDIVGNYAKQGGSRFIVSALEEGEDAAQATQRLGQQLVEQQRLAPLTRLEQLPIVGRVLRGAAGLPVTESKRIIEQSIESIKFLSDHITDDAARELARAGVRVDPFNLLWELVKNPDAAQVAGTEMAASEVARILGLSEFVVGGKEAQVLGVQAGTVVNLLHSQTVLQTRYVMEQLGDVGATNLLRSYGDVAEAYRNAHMAGRGLPLTGTRKTWRLAMADANDELAKLMARIQDTADEIAGVSERGLLGAAYQKYRALQGFMANFHMSLSPGWLIRNVTSNTMQMWSDGIVNLKGLGSIDRYLAENGFEPAIREFGGQADALAGSGKLGNFGLTPLNARMENNARQRIFTSVVENVFNRMWNRGVAIPEEAVLELEQAVGPDVAQRILGRVQQVRSLDQLASVLGKTKAADLGQALPADVARRLAQIEPGLDKVVQGIIDDSPDVMAALDDIARLDGKFGTTVQEALSNWHPLRNTGDGDAAEDFWRWMQVGGYDETQARTAWDAFNRRRAVQSMAMTQAKQYADALVSQIDEVDKALGSQFYQRARDIGEAANRRYHTEFFAVRDTMLRLVREHRWDELHTRFPQLADVSNANEFYSIWPALRDGMFEQAWRGAFDEFLALGDEVAGELGGRGLTPGYERPASDIIQALERIAPATTDQQHQMLYQLNARAVREYNVNGTFHLVNILKQEGLLDEDASFLYASDIVTPQWFDEAIAALERRAAEKAVPARAVAEGLSVEDWDDALRILAGDAKPGTFIPVDAPADFAQQANAQVMEARRVLNEVVDWLAQAGDEGAELTLEQQRAVRRFLDGLKPRLSTTRQYASQAGKLMGDRSLFNYEDRRNYDTMASMLFSYPFWYMRNAGRWTTMAWQRPGALAAWLKIDAGLRRMNYDLPAWWQDQVRIETPWGTQYVPILNAISPIQGLIGDKFRDAEREHTWYGTVLSAAGQYGPSINVVPQALIAMDAARRGEQEEMISWWNYQSQIGRAFTAGTALLHEATGVGPPGGLPTPLEMLTMWDMDTQRTTKTRWERNNMMKLGFQMVNDGEIESMEALRDALYRQEGPVWDSLLQAYTVKTSGSVFVSLFGGASFHMRPESEVEIARIDMEVQEIMRRQPGGDALDAYSDEQYRLAWDDLERRAEEKGISLDLMFMARRSGDQKHERYIWTVVNSIPPSSRDYLDAFNIEPETLNRFYDSRFDDMTESEKQTFIDGMFRLGSILQMPSDATEAEWRMAKDRYQALRDALDREFSSVDGEIFALESSYWDTRDREGVEAARQFLNDHPVLQTYWDEKNDMVTEDPLLVRYYGSMDLLERYARGQFEEEMARMFPDLDPDAFWEEYNRRKETDVEAAYAMWDEYPEMQQYLNEQDRWTLELRQTLEELGDQLGVLEGTFAIMRRDLPEALDPAQSRIKDMIQNSTLPLGDFELPEDLGTRELQAQVNLEINSIPDDLYFEVKDRLDEMGNLDSTMQAFQTWGRGGGSTGTIEANKLEVRALLQALGSIREEMGYRVVGDSTSSAAAGGTVNTRSSGGSGGSTRMPGDNRSGASDRPRRTSGRSGGGGGGTRRVRSSTYGGASEQPQNEAQQNQLDAQIDEFMVKVHRRSDRYWTYLYTMPLDQAGLTAFLEEHQDFRDWFQKVVAAYGAYFVEYLTTLRKAPSRPYRSSNSSGGLTRQRFSVQF